MSTYTYLNWLDAEQKAIQASVPTTKEERIAWWYRLSNWWHQRDLGFGDGKGMKLECVAHAKRLEAQDEPQG